METTYTLDEAINALKALKKPKFDATVEIHARLGIDPKKSDQQVRTAVVLPHGTGKTLRIAVFTEAAKQAEATSLGAEIVGGEELIKNIIATGKLDADVAVATPDMMKHLASAAKTLGPKGLMPTPKNGTVTTDLQKTLSEIKKGKVTLKTDDTGNIHGIIGKMSWDAQKLKENLTALLDAVKKAKPSSSKGTYLKSITLCSSMSKGIKIAY